MWSLVWVDKGLGIPGSGGTELRDLVSLADNARICNFAYHVCISLLAAPSSSSPSPFPYPYHHHHLGRGAASAHQRWGGKATSWTPILGSKSADPQHRRHQQLPHGVKIVCKPTNVYQHSQEKGSHRANYWFPGTVILVWSFGTFQMKVNRVF